MLHLEQTQQPGRDTFRQKVGFFLLYVMPAQVNNGIAHLQKNNLIRLLPLILLVVILSACQAGGAIPQPFCDAYNNSLYTLRLAGGAFLILGLAFLGFKKQISTILPSQGAQTGAIAGSIGIGVLLLALTTDIGSQILVTFGLPDISTQC